MQSEAVREDAAMILALCASNNTDTWKASQWLTGNALSEARTLASHALNHVNVKLSALMSPRRWTQEAYAEAESLLRTGWTPEDAR